MSEVARFLRGDFEHLLAEHERLVGLANDVEFCLHDLAGGANEEKLRALQQSAGALVGALRAHLFWEDQQVLPLLDAVSGSGPGEPRTRGTS